jgi:hypothetical protein
VRQNNDELMKDLLHEREDSDEEEQMESEGAARTEKETEKSAGKERKGEYQLLCKANIDSVQRLLDVAIGLVHFDDAGGEERRRTLMPDEPHK